jgi:hypothetical protein
MIVVLLSMVRRRFIKIWTNVVLPQAPVLSKTRGNASAHRRREHHHSKAYEMNLLTTG